MTNNTPVPNDPKYLEKVQHIANLLTAYEKRSAVDVFGHRLIAYSDGYWKSHKLHPRLVRRIKWRGRWQRLRQFFAKMH